MPAELTDRPLPGRILVTGGAGFVGASLAIALRERHPGSEVLALDNLKRRGSELNIGRLREAGVRFVHGDVRVLDDLTELDPVDVVVECSAEPSVLAGVDGSPVYAYETNLRGAFHCLELARRDRAQFVFISTSRVYPVATLEAVGYVEAESRFELTDEQAVPGLSRRGVSERCPLDGARTLYGTTKLSAELLIAEYVASFGIKAVVNRCGVIAGPWQMGKVDQGVFTYWMLAHYFKRELRYIGFGGTGKQVRDLLHVDDLVDLVSDQIARPDHWNGVTVNVGGGAECSLSLCESTDLCAEISGNSVRVTAAGESRPGDIPIYISDCSRLAEYTSWRPRRDRQRILEDIFAWINQHEREVAATL